MYSMMSANYLTAGVGALVADYLLRSSRLEFGMLAAAIAIAAAAWMVIRKRWGALEAPLGGGTAFSGSADEPGAAAGKHP
jgi:hypothetical protein